MKPGSNIDSWCGKCKLMLAHTIEAMVGNKPARVHCNTCRSQHAYRAQPPGETLRRAASGEPGDGAIPRTRTPRKNRYQTLLNGSASRPAKVYSIKEKYQAGDLLEHPIFGRGVATAVKDETKIEVLFESGSKTLVHGR